jgi:hypothetical protein
MFINATLGITSLFVGDISRETVTGVGLWYFFLVIFSLLLTIFIWRALNSKLLVARILGFSIFFVGLALGILILLLAAGVGTP